MPSLSTIQRLLVLSALAWGIVPKWGGFLFAAAWVLLVIGSSRRAKSARELLAANPDALGTFPPETNVHLQRYALTYVWPSTADKWATTWQLAGLLSAILGGVFVLWAIATFSLWYLLLLLPLVVTFFAGGAVARTIKIGDRVKEDLSNLKQTHDSIQTVVKLKMAAGKWPPSPPPEGEA